MNISDHGHSAALPRIALIGTGGTIAGAGTAPEAAASAAYRANLRTVSDASDLVGTLLDVVG